jgi:hypothetical protein
VSQSTTPDLVTAAELQDIGLALTQVRQWPVPEYTDSDGRLYWLWEDLSPWLAASCTRGGIS